jgi:hypothetical protein
MAESAVSKFFADPRYDNLDWISQAVEPWEWPVADQVAAIPQEIDITPEMVRHIARGGTELNRNSTISHIGGIDFNSLSWEATQNITKMFKFVVPDGTTFDGATLTYSNRVYLQKLKPQLDQTDILVAAAEKMTNTLSGNLNLEVHDGAAQARAGQILDLLGVPLNECRGHKQKRRALIRTLAAAVKDDRYRIRSMTLVAKIGTWVCDYINTGNLAAMANFAKFKVMTHSGNPIYSVQEVE